MNSISAVEGVHRITIPTPFAVGDVHVYLLRDGDSLTLVDTGPMTEQAEAALEVGLREIGVRVEDLAQIVLTHYHVDHTGLLAKLVARSGAKVYAHPFTHRFISQDPTFLAHRAQFFRDIYRGMGMTLEQGEMGVRQLLIYDRYWESGHVDVALAEGDKLPGHADWQVVYTPGHALDHISLYRKRDGMMLLGDHLLAHISSNAFIEPSLHAGQPRPNTLVMYREALLKVQALEWQLGFAGHGEPIKEYRELITKRLQNMEQRAAAIVEQVRRGKQTGIEICLELFPRHLNQMALVVSETLGHLDWLVADGVLACDETDSGVWLYR